MKRFVALFLTAMLILIAVGTAVSAAEGDTILKGTPVVDGVKDAIYSQSMSEELLPQFWKTGEADGNITGKLWALYDDKYLYVYAEIYGSDFQPSDPDYVKDVDNPWETNCVEIWVDELGEGDNAGKFSIYYDGSRFFYDDSRTTIDPNKTLYAASTIPGGYSVEYAIEFPAATPLKEGNTIGIAFQANEYHKAEDSTSAHGTQVPIPYKLGGAVIPPAAPAPVETPVETPKEAPAEAVAVAPTPAPAAPAVNTGVSSPKTDDASAVIFVTLFIALSGAVVFSRKSKKI